MKESEIKEILDLFPDMEIDNFLELGTRCTTCCCYEDRGHSSACFKHTESKLQHFEIFSRMRNIIGQGIEDTFNIIPTLLKSVDAPMFFFLNVRKFGFKICEGFSSPRSIHLELEVILKNQNHPSIFCLTDFDSWPDYPSWTRTISPDTILKTFKEHNQKVVDHFEKNGHYIIVTALSEPPPSPPPQTYLKRIANYFNL